MTLDELNACDEGVAREALERCCAARRWFEQMVASRPFASREALFAKAEEVFETLAESDWLEAFAGHPKIGDMENLRKKYANTASWSAGEQAGALGADDATLKELAEGNRRYEEKFGFIFIVCATGKSAAEMLALLEARLPNDRAREVQNAAAEQRKITRIRLEKLLA